MIEQKLQECRVTLQNKKLKKSGKNKYAGFEYFELKDFLPTINEMFKEKGMFSNFSIKGDTAKLVITDTEDKTTVKFTSPIAELDLKGCNKIQALGGVHTYMKRYLYLNALEIVESDLFDSVTGSGELEPNNDTDIFAGIDACTTLAELQKYYNTYSNQVADKTALNRKVNARKRELNVG